MTPTKFYRFRQNNSGGSFDHEAADGIGLALFVEAADHIHANVRAQRIGLYFEGCASGLDCSCCGDRWYPVDESDGDESPMQYAEPWRACEDGESPTLDWGIPSYIHYIGGAFKPARKAEG